MNERLKDLAAIDLKEIEAMKGKKGKKKQAIDPADLSVGDDVQVSGVSSERGEANRLDDDNMGQFIAPDDSSEDEDYKEGDGGFGHENSDPDHEHSIDSKDMGVRQSKSKSKDGKKKSKKDKKEKKSKKDKHKKSHKSKDENMLQDPADPETPVTTSKKRRLKKGADIESLEQEVKDSDSKRQKMS